MIMAAVRDCLADESLGQSKGRIRHDSDAVHFDRLRQIIADHSNAAALPTIIHYVGAVDDMAARRQNVQDGAGAARGVSVQSP